MHSGSDRKMKWKIDYQKKYVILELWCKKQQKAKKKCVQQKIFTLYNPISPLDGLWSKKSPKINFASNFGSLKSIEKNLYAFFLQFT